MLKFCTPILKLFCKPIQILQTNSNTLICNKYISDIGTITVQSYSVWCDYRYDAQNIALNLMFLSKKKKTI